jgi:hypothetical protein
VYLSDFCGKLFAEEFASKVEPNYTCPINEFDLWLQEQSNSTQPDEAYVDNCAGATGIPVPKDSFHSCIIAWTQLVDETYILSHNGQVEIIFFPFASRVRYDDHYDDLDNEWNLIEDWMDNEMKQAPNGANRGYFSSEDFWWYDTNGQMLNTAISSAGIALAASAAAILFSSRSFVMTIFATLTILYILVSVTAILVGLGWTLGFLEAICFAVLIGISVDFVIHFSHAYCSLLGDRERGERTQFALIRM